jgi:hypothetical protein
MRTLAWILIIIAIIATIVGVISRIIFAPILGLTSRAFLQGAGLLLLYAITFLLLEKK